MMDGTAPFAGAVLVSIIAYRDSLEHDEIWV
jgi:hypothetical protein